MAQSYLKGPKVATGEIFPYSSQVSKGKKHPSSPSWSVILSALHSGIPLAIRPETDRVSVAETERQTKQNNNKERNEEDTSLPNSIAELLPQL